MKLLGFVLSSGREIVGKVHANTDTHTHLKDVLYVHMSRDQSGVKVSFLPLTFLSDVVGPCELMLQKCLILMPFVPSANLERAYVEQISGIVIP